MRERELRKLERAHRDSITFIGPVSFGLSTVSTVLDGQLSRKISSFLSTLSYIFT